MPITMKPSFTLKFQDCCLLGIKNGCFSVTNSWWTQSLKTGRKIISTGPYIENSLSQLKYLLCDDLTLRRR